MSHKLLLADDSITIQKVVELVLAEEDFEIKSVNNGEEALNVIDSFKPDIVLADIEMPVLNGYQLCEKLKSNPETSNIPVILLAGAFAPIDEDLATKAGADDSLIKPFESQELISKINAGVTMSLENRKTVEPGVAAEEVLAFAEEAAFGAETGPDAEVLESVGQEEDLWVMEDLTESTEDLAAIAGELGVEMHPEMTAEETAGEPEPAAEKTYDPPEITVPSKEEFLEKFEKSVDDKVSSFLSSIDIKEELLSSLMPSMQNTIEKIMWEIAPELLEKMLKEVLKDSIATLTAEVEKVIWETVPDLASSMISKEIEKIRSEF
ncbi:MAG: response regulator [Nitrospirota bacterium]|nr:response regulator [Nitrospirota bacterium]